MGILNIILFFTGISLVLCKEYMPVVIWGGQPTANSVAEVSAFAKMNSNEFTDYLLKKVKLEKPTILAFLEENLSVEDFSWRDVTGKGAFPLLKKISTSADGLTYLPSVQDPKKGLLNLRTFGYAWKVYNESNLEPSNVNDNIVFEVKLKEPDLLEDRPDMLRKHDEQIAKVYNDVSSVKSNVLAIYTGKHNSWISSEVKRFKRDTIILLEDDSNDMVITDDKNVVRMAVTPPIVYEAKDPEKDPVVVNITRVIGTPTIDVEKDKISMTARFSFQQTDISVKFEFSSADDDWWTLDTAEILDFKLKNLTPSVPIGAPAQYSYFCNPSVVFSNNIVSLTFENLQVQPRVGKGNPFGPVMHCIPYFSIAIWSGLVIVLILSVVLGWGIVMIMDINTNDRFDDPKGKTITVTATD